MRTYIGTPTHRGHTDPRAYLCTHHRSTTGQEEKQQFQKDQLMKIFNVVGKPTVEHWRQVSQLAEWQRVANMELVCCLNCGARRAVEDVSSFG